MINIAPKYSTDTIIYLLLLLPSQLRSSRLDITYILKLNEGNYTCLAKNDAGSANRNFSIEVTAFMGHRTVNVGDLPAAEASIESVHSNFGNKNSNHDTSHHHHLHHHPGSGGGVAVGVTNNNNNNPKNAGSAALYGMILGVLFGMFITAFIFGSIIILFCRKRSNSRSNTLASNRVVAAESELEKLTTSNCMPGFTPDIHQMPPPCVVDIINPIQKPPRLSFYHIS